MLVGVLFGVLFRVTVIDAGRIFARRTAGCRHAVWGAVGGASDGALLLD